MDANQDLFAVTTSRVHDGETLLRHTNFWSSRENAENYARSCRIKGFEVLSIKHWRFVENIPVPEVK